MPGTPDTALTLTLISDRGQIQRHRVLRPVASIGTRLEISTAATFVTCAPWLTADPDGNEPAYALAINLEPAGAKSVVLHTREEA